MHKAQTLQKTTFTIPNDVAEWLRRRATHNVSSMNAETIRALRNQMHIERVSEQKEGAAR